ncbi:hypothetical protein BOX15_Mlig008737g1, partial [Macrostomum lignano]
SLSSFEPHTKQQVLEEISAITEQLSVRCRVIDNVGSFQFVVSLACDRSPQLAVKLQLTDQYPLEPPCVSVRSAPATEAELAALANSLRGRAMLQQLAAAAFPAGTAALSAVNEAAEVSNSKQAAAPPSRQRRYESARTKRRRRAAAAAAADESKQAASFKAKLKPMKTADDVLKRIQWDEGIPAQDIFIGYLDRFKGVVEKQFDEFSWEDIASVDYYTFVIPRHRICYFKYRRAVIWDKRRRLDLVFGSTATADDVAEGADIYKLIANYRDEDYPDGEASMASAASSSNSEADESDESDESDDDGVQVRLDRRIVESAAQRCGDDGDSLSEGEDQAQLSGTAKVYWRDLLRPNFFVCVRVVDPAVASAAAAVQASIVRQQPAFASCCIPPEMLHCTLATLRLDSAEQVSACSAALSAARSELLASLPREPLRLRGLGCFFGRVLHARVDPAPAGLTDFVDHLQAVIRAAGLQVLETHEFVPHVTLLKTSRPVSRQLGSRLIPPRLYAGSEGVDFGEQPLDAVYLCSMEKARGPDGFYVAPGCVQFVRTVLEQAAPSHD